MSIIKIFNNQLISFSNTLVERFPNNKNFKIALTGIETIKMANPRKNIDMFLLYVYKYRDRVMVKDEKFMLKNDFISENFEEKELGVSSSFLIMDSIKENWKSLENSEKNNIWKYLQVLVKLCDKYIKESL
tara:strand:+ start:52 stop:444 length:393 start_codon:yes stop_codon:yes gene_type:complete